MRPFRVDAPYGPAGDQAQAIDLLASGVKQGLKWQTLKGVTGSGKTFFPDNAVEYFVSYYDYYQPEAYVPSKDLYIEKDSNINEEIDQIRLYIDRGSELDLEEVKRKLVSLQYVRNDAVLERGRFRVRGDVLEIYPAYLQEAYMIELEYDLERLEEMGYCSVIENYSALPEGRSLTLITQNVDDLHATAGSRALIEYHGNVLRTRCSNRSCAFERFKDPRCEGDEVPICPLCGAALRPDIVLFGEEIPAEAARGIETALADCDVFLAVLGGAHTVYVNLESLRASYPSFPFDEEVLGRAEELLPGLLGLD